MTNIEILLDFEKKIMDAKNKVIVCPTASNNISFLRAVQNYNAIKKYLESKKGVM
jgi:hypothetical protein